MNEMLGELLDVCVVVYLDDILVYSKTKEDHQKHLEAVFQKLAQRPFYCKLKKCEFFMSEVKFLGYIVSDKGVRVNPAKVRSI